MKGFGSDNHSGVHPDLLQSLINANTEHMPSYGTDPISELAQKKFQEIFGKQSQVFFVFNGTGANVAALKALGKSYQSVVCTDVAHIHVDECGAPEALTGLKLISTPSVHGKMQLKDLQSKLIRRGDQHFSQPQILSLTQPTELGTCYSVDELKTLIEFAKSQKMLVHIDGSRLANACIYLNKSFQELTTDLGVDIVSLGGTKNGFMMGEAVVILNPSYAENFKYIRKQLCQLPSKTRFIAAQYLHYFDNDLWKKIATHSHQMALALHESVAQLPGVTVTQNTQSNAVFAIIPQKWVKPLREKYFFYVWDESTFECRWMTSWDTQIDEIKGFQKAIEELGKI